jgi:RimJ/RimL family protein N-acetyltransferase
MLLEAVGQGRYMLVDDRMLDWIAARIPQVGPDHDWHGRARGLGCVVDGKIVAGMACMNFDARHAHVEIAFASDSPRWASRRMIARFMAWPLRQLGCRRVSAVVAADNRRVIRLLEGMGFRREGVLRRAFGAEDALILGLLNDEVTPWLEKELGALQNFACPWQATTALHGWPKS